MRLVLVTILTVQDTIKTRAQTAPRGQFNGTWDIARQTVRKEGFLALYKGMMSSVCARGD